jgi:NADH-quinone oxidoreductase subunit B
LACCAIEMMATGASRYDMDRFGAGAFRATPAAGGPDDRGRYGDYKMASRVRRLYNQMPDPKFVIAMGACTVGGGPVLQVGLPRRQGRRSGGAGRRLRARLPAASRGVLEGLMRIQDKINGHRIAKRQSEEWRFGFGSKVEDELPVPPHSATSMPRRQGSAHDHQKITGYVARR